MLADEMVKLEEQLLFIFLITKKLLFIWHYSVLFNSSSRTLPEQGLGKTIIVLSLLAVQQENVSKIIERDEQFYPIDEVYPKTFFTFLEMKFNGFLQTQEWRCQGTVIVCPNHLCKQWESEIKKHTRYGS